MTTIDPKTIQTEFIDKLIELADGGVSLFPQLKAAIIEAAQRDPERTAICSYVDEGEPMCIVGQAMVDAELMTVEELLEFDRDAYSFLILETEDDEYPKYIPDSTFRWLAYYFDKHLNRGSLGTYGEILDICSIQQNQDHGDTWEYAVHKVWWSE